MKHGTGSKPEFQKRYCHMQLKEAVIWRRFLNRGGIPFVEVWYDVHVGQAMRIPCGCPEFIKAVADGVSRKRIDVLARTKVGFWVIELKRICGPGAIGQVDVYRDLAIKELDLDGVVEAVIICDQVDVDVGATASRDGVRVISFDGVLL